MRTSAGKNGRAATPHAAGRPTCDEVYARLAAEVLRGLAPDRVEDVAAAVARRFKEGAATLCCRAIGGWLERQLVDRGWTQQELADRVGVDRSAVARWTAGGAISLGHLVLVLLEFRSDFADLPVPARQELALEGYIAALAQIRATLAPDAKPEPMDRERFWCLYHLFSEPHWERAIRARDGEGIRREVRRVFECAAEALGHPPREVVGVEGLRRLVDRWAAAWVVCLHVLPGSWSVR